jgi:hypothetical protein
MSYEFSFNSRFLTPELSPLNSQLLIYLLSLLGRFDILMTR